METKAHYVIVGAISILATAFIIAFVLYLGGSETDRQHHQYDVVFEGGVSGLQRGADVKYNGISVGSVEEIKLDEVNPNTVLARIRVVPQTPIKTDSFAVLEPQGLTGLNYILINAGTDSEPLLREVSEAKIPRISAQKGTIEALLVGGEEIIQSSNQALIRLNRLLSSTNLERFNKILADTERLMARLAILSENFEADGRVMQRLEHSLAAFERAAVQLEKTAQDVSALTQTTDRFLSNEASIAMRDVSTSAIEFYDASVDGAAYIEDLSAITKKLRMRCYPNYPLLWTI